MKYLLLIFLFFHFSNNKLFSTGWEAMGNGFNHAVLCLYIDSANNKIYAGGQFRYADSLSVDQIAVWDGAKWDSLAGGNYYNGNIRSICVYDGDVYSDGRFFPSIHNFGGKFNGTQWDSLGNGSDGPIAVMKIVNTDLLIGGIYTTVNGTSCNMISLFDGINWNCIPTPYNNEVRDIFYYQGNLVMGGNFFDSTSNIDLAKNGSNGWQVIGHPIYGGLSGINTIIEYRGDLYVGGYFTQANGNEGNHIMRWNGSQWNDVSGGTDNEVVCFHILNDELYVGGKFEYAGGVHTGGFARWNGQNWSQVANTIYGLVFDIDDYNNDLYIAGGFQFIDSIQVNNIARYRNYVEVSEFDIASKISISPNPASGRLKVNNPSRRMRYSIIDEIGRNVSEGILNNGNSEINISEISSGIYFIKIESENRVFSQKIIIQNE